MCFTFFVSWFLFLFFLFSSIFIYSLSFSLFFLPLTPSFLSYCAYFHSSPSNFSHQPPFRSFLYRSVCSTVPSHPKHSPLLFFLTVPPPPLFLVPCSVSSSLHFAPFRTVPFLAVSCSVFLVFMSDVPCIVLFLCPSVHVYRSLCSVPFQCSVLILCVYLCL